MARPTLLVAFAVLFVFVAHFSVSVSPAMAWGSGSLFRGATKAPRAPSVAPHSLPDDFIPPIRAPRGNAIDRDLEDLLSTWDLNLPPARTEPYAPPKHDLPPNSTQPSPSAPAPGLKDAADLGTLIRDLPADQRSKLVALHRKIFAADDVAKVELTDIGEILVIMEEKTHAENLDRIVVGISSGEKAILEGAGILCLKLMILDHVLPSPQQSESSQRMLDISNTICSNLDADHPVVLAAGEIAAIGRALHRSNLQLSRISGP